MALSLYVRLDQEAEKETWFGKKITLNKQAALCVIDLEHHRYFTLQNALWMLSVTLTYSPLHFKIKVW